MGEQNIIPNVCIRKIIHIDMDAFYASVEQRDNPSLIGKPVIVGGPPNSRGVVSTCSYEARKFGVHSAMSSSQAYRLCPEGIFVKPRFEVYKKVSLEIRSIFHEYTDLVEPLSLDEAYLDVTDNKKGIPLATEIAKEILKKIKEKTGLNASAGISFNKFLAKVASGYRKPKGFTVITPRTADAFIDNLPIGKFYGVGKVTENKMLSIGIKNGADLKKISRDELIHHFGKAGNYYFDIAHGNDNREVTPNRIRKSIGKEITLSKDIDDREEMLNILKEIANDLEIYLKKHNVKGKTVTLKIKFFNFKSISRSLTVDEPIQESKIIMKIIFDLIEKTDAGKIRVRLLGISLSTLQFN